MGSSTPKAIMSVIPPVCNLPDVLLSSNTLLWKRSEGSGGVLIVLLAAWRCYEPPHHNRRGAVKPAQLALPVWNQSNRRMTSTGWCMQGATYSKKHHQWQWGFLSKVPNHMTPQAQRASYCVLQNQRLLLNCDAKYKLGLPYESAGCWAPTIGFICFRHLPTLLTSSCHMI